jgi:hypothetical protein
MEIFADYIKKIKYVVISENKTCELFTSLRQISKKTDINFSTISKNLKDEGKCFCTSKITKKQYYIYKLSFSSG